MTNIETLQGIFNDLSGVLNSNQARTILQDDIRSIVQIIIEQERRIEALEKFNEETYG